KLRTEETQSQEKAMKYFTPDLLARFGSPDDTIANAASEEWERAQAAYLEYLQAIRPTLPKGGRQLLDRFCLHDARVLARIFDERPVFSIVLQPQKPRDPRDQLLELKYRLARPPKFARQQPPPEDGTPLQWWLYDEIGVVNDEPVFVFTHS